MTKEDLVCEDHFIKTHYREKSIRYVVRLPFKEPPPAVNDSYQVAVRRLKRVERALKGQPTLCTMYKDFMYEYVVIIVASVAVISCLVDWARHQPTLLLLL
ncbi:unnamed protein product [Macrosiphum euphorbiae]|uniref:Uncharacterized protein n=1 Tax=Macrosiphum euphorbiae TaxID=13131 RepID=A0AAV0Y0M0_9HEMI|nr:unnamed protein product [Macrosiphum euphorbiae]